MRVRKHYFLFFLLLSFSVALLFVWNYWWTREWIEMYRYDRSHQEKAIETRAEIDAVLNSFTHIPFAKLPAEYKVESHSDQAPFKKMLLAKSYYRIKGKDIYRKIIGDHRIKDLLSKDAFYKKHILAGEESELYLLVDKKLLYCFLELKAELKNKGFDSEAYVLKSVHRHPQKNKEVGGASRSRHILGEALDISIKDINRDGRTNGDDKQIVLDILDKKVIGNKGGIGLYPNTQSVHFDVRGKRARWNTY
ncbi:MAG: D-Ala-D-Ala carboxypeptidase family metallohydrolase [Bacteroidota bacterium]